MFASKPPSEWTAQDLDQLISDQESEGRTLDYKETLPGKSDEEKKEFLTDVSSFANGAGGYLLYGIAEDKGIPTAACGFDAKDMDSEILRLDQTIRSGIEPRVFGISMQAVSLPNGKHALVVYIPKSWNRPHAVTFKGTPGSLRFFSRSTNGKYPLDIAELRSAFVGAETEAERIRTFRAERLASISADGLPVAIPNHRKAVMHLVPLGAFDPGAAVNLSAAAQYADRMKTSMSQVYGNRRYNFDGYLSWEPLDDPRTGDVYLQVFRNGIIEAVNAEVLNAYDGSATLPASAFEEEEMGMLPRWLALQRHMGVQPPLLVMLSLIGVNGLAIETRTSAISTRGPDPIDREVLMLPDVLLDAFECDAAQVLRPAFDVLWNAAGYAGSLNYDEHGNRKSFQ